LQERLTAETNAVTSLGDANRELQQRAEAAETESRRNALDRQRFAAYLEEGLALLGVIPPAPAAPDEPPTEQGQ
jgi:hypothetical protein